MQHHHLFASVLLLACALPAQVIYENGPLVTHPGGGTGGADLSALQVGAPFTMDLLGSGAQFAAGNSLADDFAVNGVMSITDIEVYGYLTGNPAPVVTLVTVAVYGGGPPSTTGTVVTGSPAWGTNLVGLSGYTVATTATNTYRASSATPLDANRRVQAIKVTLPAPLVLTTGVYWLRFGYTGVNFTPPISVLGEPVTGNALQNTTAGGWLNAQDIGPAAAPVPVPYQQGFPFKLYGTSATVPGSVTALTLPSCGTTTIAVKGAPVLGGLLRTTLSGVTGLGLIGYGFSSTATGFCTCVVGHEWASVNIGAAHTLRLPMNIAFVGAALRIQGADFGGTGGCPNPQVNFTTTHRLQIQ